MLSEQVVIIAIMAIGSTASDSHRSRTGENEACFEFLNQFPNVRSIARRPSVIIRDLQ